MLGVQYMKFTCTTCGDEHDLSEISFGVEAPVQWRLLNEEERANSKLTEEQCVLETNNGRHFFIRARLQVPIIDIKGSFTWGVWCSLSETSFIEMSDHWNDPERTKKGPYFGWLCTQIPGYPDTMFLKTMVHQAPVGLRPTVVLEEDDHSLSIDQKQGIAQDKLKGIIENILHDGDARR